MNMIINTVIQEKQRIDYMIEHYSDALRDLPRGSLYERKVKDKTYYYLKYREGDKVVSKYVPADKVDVVREQIERRRHTEKMLASLRKEKDLADKFLGGAV